MVRQAHHERLLLCVIASFPKEKRGKLYRFLIMPYGLFGKDCFVPQAGLAKTGVFIMLSSWWSNEASGAG
jgi:hypothetical protein